MLSCTFELYFGFQGKTRADLEKSLSPNELANDGRANLGEASLYDIYYDDTEYDYMQHLRPINNGENQEDGVESILLPAPAVTKFSRKGKAPADPSNFLKHPSESSQIPSEALPSSIEVERDYESQMAVPSSIAGFQPDMNVHLRQTLEALENDAFLDDEVEDDFFVELLKEGERDDGEDVDFGFEESDLENNEARLPVPTIRESSSGSSQVDDNWMVRFAQFKREEAQNVGSRSEADEPGGSEDRDTVSGLPKLLVRGGKRRRKGASDASGYSLSSSSMFRNKGLSTLDEQFAEVGTIKFPTLSTAYLNALGAAA
jgi:protein LTV1